MELAEITTATMVGAGTMGSGMGLCFAQAGFEVVLYDPAPAQLERALARIKNSQAALIREGVLTEAQARTAQGRIRVSADLAQAVGRSQFVLEAAPEVLEVKHRLFQDLEAAAAPETILASNTSGLPITAIASVCRRPERVGGMHWVNPPELVPLVEVIPGEKTAAATTQTIHAVARKLGKQPILVKKEVPGFVMNRLQFAAFREALHLVEAGVASPADVDAAMRYGVGFRYPWVGPLETADLGGLDIFHNVAAYLFKDLSAMTEPSPWLKERLAQGELGIKTGRGFYDYGAVDREKVLEARDIFFIRLGRLVRELQAKIGQGS